MSVVTYEVNVGHCAASKLVPAPHPHDLGTYAHNRGMFFESLG